MVVSLGAKIVKLIDFFETEYRPRRLFGKSQNSVRLYRLSIEALEKYLERPALLTDLTNATIIGLMQARLDGRFRGKSRGTANKDRCQLLAIWRLACRDGLLQTWPEVPQLIEPERTPKAWTRDDLDALFKAIDRLREDIGGVPASLWWRSIVMLALDTGERIGGMFDAEWSWLEGQWLHIPAEARKGGRRDRKYWLSATTCGLLNRIRQCRADEARIFVWPFHRNYLWRRYEAILAAARLPHGREDKFHRLRKTTASVLHSKGINAQEALDHQHRRTTRRYIDPRFVQCTKPSEILADFLANPTLRQKSLRNRRKSG